MMKIADLMPMCVLPTYSHDVLYVHKDDVDKEMSVCLFMTTEKGNERILLMHQTQMYLTRSLIDYEIDRTAENIKSVLVNPMLNTEVFDNCDDAVMVIDEQIIEDDIKVFEILAVRKGDTGIKFISDAGITFVIISVE